MSYRPYQPKLSYRNYWRKVLALVLFFIIFLLDFNLSEQKHGIFAQEFEEDAPKTNKNFYKHDYAKSPLELKNEQAQSSKLPASDSKIANSAQDIAPDSVENGINPNSVNTIDPSAKNKIESISVIENGLDFAAILKSSEILLRLFNERDIRPSTIFLVGQSYDKPDNALNQQIRRLGLIGAKVNVVESPPENFKVTKLPSWIITTKEGDIVLEGSISPEKFISPKGEFINPKDISAGQEIAGGIPSLGSSK